jgi:hypothetical protein
MKAKIIEGSDNKGEYYQIDVGITSYIVQPSYQGFNCFIDSPTGTQYLDSFIGTNIVELFDEAKNFIKKAVGINPNVADIFQT